MAGARWLGGRGWALAVGVRSSILEVSSLILPARLVLPTCPVFPAGWLAGWLAGGWLGGWLADWLAGWLAGWVAGLEKALLDSSWMLSLAAIIDFHRLRFIGSGGRAG